MRVRRPARLIPRAVKEPLPLLIAGATGVGKSSVALELAKLLGGEIISVDSMQVYRGLDIGTAKPGRREREEIVHHLIDIRTLAESFDAAAFVREAETAREAITTRGHVTIFCGGTGLYFKAWLGGLGTAPPADPELRRELEELPIPVLLDELERLDPKTFGSIDRQNKRRIVRAVEVVRLTGKPFSEQRAIWDQVGRPVFAVALERTPGDLHRRVAKRVDGMFAAGLVEETRKVLAELRANQTASQAIGYKQLIDFFDGKLSLAETIEAIKIKTRQFAKRQRTWFKHQMQLEWILLDESSDIRKTAEAIARTYENASG